MKIIIHKGEKSNYFFTLIICIVCCIFGLTPALTQYSTEAIITLFFVCLPFIVRFLNVDRDYRNLCVFSTIYIAIMVIYKALNISSCEWYWIGAYISWIIITLVSLSTLRAFNKKSLFLLVAAIVIIMAINEIVIYSNNSALKYSQSGVHAAATQYSTAISFFAGIIFLLLLRCKNYFAKVIFAILWLLSVSINVSILQRTTNIIIIISLCVILLIFNTRRKSKGKLIFAVACIIFLFMWISGLLEVVLGFVASNITSSRVAERMNDIVLFIKSGSIDETAQGFSGRYDLTMLSLKTFFSSLRNFFFGIGDHRSNYLLIGNHSDIIDVLPRYGVVGFTFLILVLTFQWKCIKKHFGNDSLALQICIVFYFYIFRNIIGNSFITYVAIIAYIMLMAVGLLLDKSERCEYYC